MTGSCTRPRWMRASAAVDLDQLRYAIRPVMRSQVAGPLDRVEVRRWARRSGFFAVVDRDGFFSISRSASSARRTLRIDARPGRHLMALGRALGYPDCCCLAARRRSEEGLDAWAQVISKRRFAGLFRLIYPGGYLAGGSSLSHIPCSARCRASLRMAVALVGEKGRSRCNQARSQGRGRRGACVPARF